MSDHIAIRVIAVVFAALVGFGPLSARGQSASVSVVSFNIQFLGQFKNRDNEALADLMAPHDVVFIQELVAPPYAGMFPDGVAYKPDPEATTFFDAMRAKGFSYVLSEEDTGSGERNHLNSSATEWFVAFYKPGRVSPANDLTQGFLGEDRTNHPDYERVPYAFPFRAGNVDLVFISVHLQPGASKKERERRAHELTVIGSWIASRQGSEGDYVILGDMNIEDCEELAEVLPDGYASLNNDCLPTNTNLNGPKPYDHVLFHTVWSEKEVDTSAGLRIVNLIDAMRSKWPPSSGPYPGFPYQHDEFRTRYSDHHPVMFQIRTDGPDDD